MRERRAIERGIRLPAGLRTVCDGLDHPEGICWCPTAQALYAGGEHGQIYRVGLTSGAVELIAHIPNGFILGLAVDGDGCIYACDIGNHCVQQIDPADSKVEAYGSVIAYPNYPVFAVDGCLYVSDSGSWESNGDGSIMRIVPGGNTNRLDTPPLRFPNGLALLGDWLFVVESTRPGVVKVPRRGGNISLALELDRVIPDGLAFDAQGGLWISCWQPNRIMRLAPNGALDIVADDWSGIHVLTPNNLAFAGPKLEELAFPALGGNFIRAFMPKLTGRALHYPKGLP
jgi:sugar lactone lactonase YvrE